MTLHLIVHSHDGAEEDRCSLPLGDERKSFHWQQRCLPGASAIHLVLADDESVRWRAEIPAESGEMVSIRLDLDDHGNASISSPGRHVLTLPPDERYAPPAPIVPAETGDLDLALIVDGTSRVFFLEETDELRRITSRSLLEDPESWPETVEKLTAVAAALHEAHPSCRATVIAFGDHRPVDVAADDLQPRYLLHPADEEAQALRPQSPEQLQRELLAIPATSGSDFIDAVPEALAICANLRWRPEARKVAILFGDSPGHSILHPIVPGGDGGVRELDVDTQAMRLHELGIELVTVYNDPPADIGLEDIAVSERLVAHARRQYRRLASLRRYAFEASSLDPSTVAERILAVKGPIARGPALGELASHYAPVTE